MLPLPPFEFHHPRTLAEAVSLRASRPSSLYIAGGTDLLPNLKHQLHAPEHLISLSKVEDLGGIAETIDGGLRVGAAATLHQVASSALVRERAPALALAAGLVAGPQHRRMGTIGGNVLLDTRCLFYNQSQMWRTSLDFCLKKDGTRCHVIGSRSLCVAAQSSDTVPALIALGATLDFLDTDGPKTIAVDDLFGTDGRFDRRLTVGGTALLASVVVPPPAPGQYSTFRKVRPRGAIDFAQLNVALSVRFVDGRVAALRGCIGAVMPKPRLITGWDAAIGTTLDDDTLAACAEEAYKQAKPQRTLAGDVDERRHRARIEVTRGLRDLRRQALGA